MSPSKTPSLPPNRFRDLSFELDGQRRALTTLEEQIVRLICDGLSDEEIIDQLVHPPAETGKKL
jgi:ATP/maltotriose-dependent transcriptional regulator MalT